MLFSLDLSSEVPIYVQIRNNIVIAISKGELNKGEKLPPVRTFADEIGVNSMTVSKAYQMLKQEGYIYTDRRKGAIICDNDKGKGILSDELKNRLRLLISEASYNGVSKDNFIKYCSSIYDEMEGV